MNDDFAILIGENLDSSNITGLGFNSNIVYRISFLTFSRVLKILHKHSYTNKTRHCNVVNRKKKEINKPLEQSGDNKTAEGSLSLAR